MNLDRQGVCEYSWSPKSQHVLIFQLNELEDRNGEGLENDTPLQLWRVLYESGLVTQSKIFYVFFFPLNIFFIVWWLLFIKTKCRWLHSHHTSKIKTIIRLFCPALSGWVLYINCCIYTGFKITYRINTTFYCVCSKQNIINANYKSTNYSWHCGKIVFGLCSGQRKEHKEGFVVEWRSVGKYLKEKGDERRQD